MILILLNFRPSKDGRWLNDFAWTPKLIILVSLFYSIQSIPERFFNIISVVYKYTAIFVQPFCLFILNDLLYSIFSPKQRLIKSKNKSYLWLLLGSVTLFLGVLGYLIFISYNECFEKFIVLISLCTLLLLNLILCHLKYKNGLGMLQGLSFLIIGGVLAFCLVFGTVYSSCFAVSKIGSIYEKIISAVDSFSGRLIRLSSCLMLTRVSKL